MQDMALAAVDLSQHTFTPDCDQGCGRKAAVIAQGCADKTPVLMCDECLELGIERIKTVIHYYQRLNHKIMICGDCHRPFLRLDTHLDVRRLET